MRMLIWEEGNKKKRKRKEQKKETSLTAPQPRVFYDQCSNVGCARERTLIIIIIMHQGHMHVLVFMLNYWVYEIRYDLLCPSHSATTKPRRPSIVQTRAVAHCAPAYTTAILVRENRILCVHWLGTVAIDLGA